MSNQDINAFDELNIANFAENLIKEDRKSGPTVIGTKAGFIEAKGPDMSKVAPVDEYMIGSILESGFGVKKLKPRSEGASKLVVKEQKVITQDPTVYVQKLISLIKEAQDLIKEMTDCGSIGMNMASAKVGFKTKIGKKKKVNPFIEKFRDKYVRIKKDNPYKKYK